VQHERIDVRTELGDNERHCAMRPEMNATSRLSLSSFATTIEHLRLRAWSSAATS
jgi:hypothetical protein